MITQDKMSVQSFIDSIASQTGIDSAVAERVAGIMFSVVQHERPDLATRLFDKIPGAEELANANDVMAKNAEGGLFSWIANAAGNLAGERIGALLKGLAALKASGLTMEQIKQVALQALSHVRELDTLLADELKAHFRSLKARFGL
jgi:DNA integrity scanning protein DisA with diadenylate cyclase activity